jgi:hypothetical protein
MKLHFRLCILSTGRKLGFQLWEDNLFGFKTLSLTPHERCHHYDVDILLACSDGGRHSSNSNKQYNRQGQKNNLCFINPI